MTWIIFAILVGILFYRLSRISRRLERLETELAALPLPEPVVHEPVVPQPVATEPVVTAPLLREEPAPFAEPVFAAAASERAGPSLREALGGVEWEAVLGGSWLNKLGVLVLVIGIALLLGYSFGHIGPAGRIMTAGVITAAMLAGGVVLEKRERYAMFARGLIGGGWAGLYFTAYAAHAIEAARVIDNPFAATILLSVIAAAMILHSLRYQSEVVTGLAYFVTFMTLAISPATSFAIVASVPLAVSLVALAHRFRWTTMMLFGVPATYLHYALQAARSTGGSFLAAQTIVTIYWLLFEVLDVFDARRQRETRGVGAAVFFLNAAGFVGISWLQWSHEYPETLYLFFVGAAVVYLVSACIRGRAGYQGPSAIAALSAGIAICQRFTGMTLNLGLLLEGELLFLAGLFLKQPFLRYLGGAVFVALWTKVAVSDVWTGARITIAGSTWRSWSPVAVLAAVLFYGNLALLASSWLFGYAASALTIIVLGCELPREYVGLGWLLFAAVLFEVGTRKRLDEFRVQALGAAALSAVPLFLINVLGAGVAGRPHWMPLLASALIAYAAAARNERGRLRGICSSAGAVLMAAFLANVLPAHWVSVGWAAFGLLLLSTGPDARRQSYGLAAATFLRTWAVDFHTTAMVLDIPARIVAGGLVVLSFYAAVFIMDRVAVYARAGFCASAGALLAVLLFHEVSGGMLTVAWGLQGVALLAIGFPAAERNLRLSGLFLLLFCILKLFFYDLRNLETPQRIISFIALGVILMGVSWAYTRFRGKLSRYL